MAGGRGRKWIGFLPARRGSGSFWAGWFRVGRSFFKGREALVHLMERGGWRTTTTAMIMGTITGMGTIILTGTIMGVGTRA